MFSSPFTVHSSKLKILIATAWYSPFIHPRAHRWTAIAEHWAKEGHEVHVLTARLRERRSDELVQAVQVHRVGFDSLKEWVYYLLGSRQARGRVGVKPVKPSLLAKFGAWAYKRVWKNLYFPDDACLWYFPAKRKLRQLLHQESFDVLITVSLPFTGHLLGLAARKMASFHSILPTSSPKNPFWLADIGDPFSFQASRPNNLFFYGHKNHRLERKILETADAVTVTTEATLCLYRSQFGEKAVAKMSVIPPLYTPCPPTTPPTPSYALASAGKNPPLHQYPPPTLWLRRVKIPQSPITKLGYFGALYAPTRTPDALLDLLQQTFAVHPEWRNRIEVHFYGEVFPEFFDQLNAEPSIQLHGLCSREAVQIAMQEMDILLNIGNTTDFQLPSKAVDYLAAGKPVLNLSYVERDPFAGLFQGNPLFFNLKVESGRVGNTELRRWLDWLETEKPSFDKAAVGERIKRHLVEQVADGYLRLLSINSKCLF